MSNRISGIESLVQIIEAVQDSPSATATATNNLVSVLQHILRETYTVDNKENPVFSSTVLQRFTHIIRKLPPKAKEQALLEFNSYQFRHSVIIPAVVACSDFRMKHHPGPGITTDPTIVAVGNTGNWIPPSYRKE